MRARTRGSEVEVDEVAGKQEVATRSDQSSGVIATAFLPATGGAKIVVSQGYL